MLRNRSTKLALVIASSLSVAATTVVADDQEPAGPVIPPNQEAVIAGMLGMGTELVDCRFAGGGAQYDVIKATYACLGRDLTVQLAHPRNATAGSIRTTQFAITVDGGTPSRGFLEVLVSLVRSREPDFVWAAPERDTEASDGDVAE